MSALHGQAHHGTVRQLEIREAFSLRLQDRALLEALQDRLSGLYRLVSKSDMVRAGLWHITNLTDAELEELLNMVGGREEAGAAV